ncbi:MAG: hypothetical protein ACXVLQ_02590 [Bacteriovorax sp.]
MKKYALFAIFPLLFSPLLKADLKIESRNLVISPYTDVIEKISEKEIAELFKKYSLNQTGNIGLTCLETNESKLYIGLWHGLAINSKLLEAAKVLEDFEKYSEVFEGIENSKVIKKTDSDKWIVEFENKSPVFFLPNIHYQMEYALSPVTNGRLYKYHLSTLYQQNNITFSDGLILLKEENGKTKFYELDFFNANWGVAGKIAGSNIWRDSVKELAVSDFELKFKAENVKLSSAEKKEKVHSFLKLVSEEHLIEKCIEDKVSAKKFFSK